MTLVAGQRAVASDFITKAQANAVPSVDAGRVPRFEANGALHPDFTAITITDTLNLALLKGNFVGSAVFGGISRPNSIVSAVTGTSPTGTGNLRVGKTVGISANKYVTLFWYDGETTGRAVVTDYNPTTKVLTIGNSQIVTVGSVRDRDSAGMSIDRLAADKFVVGFGRQTASQGIYATACSVSGTTITVGTSVLLNGVAGDTNFCGVCYLSDNRFFYAGSLLTSPRYGTCTVSGTTITVEFQSSSTTLIATLSTNLMPIKIGTDKVAIFCHSSGNSIVATTNGAITFGAAVVASHGAGNSMFINNHSIFSPSTDTFITISSDTATARAARYHTVAGTVITLQSNSVALVAGSYIWQYAVNSKFYWLGAISAVNGLYEVTVVSNTPVFTLVLPLSTYISSMLVPYGNTPLGVGGPTGAFTFSDMITGSDNLLGFLREDAAAAATGTVVVAGVYRSTGAFIKGLRYNLTAGAFVVNTSGKYLAFSNDELYFTP